MKVCNGGEKMKSACVHQGQNHVSDVKEHVRLTFPP